METLMITNIQTDFILRLYEKYIDDLRTVRKNQRALRRKHVPSLPYLILIYGFRKLGFPLFKKQNLLSPQFDDVEAEITYLLIREFRPKNVVEISPCGGWSTSWILTALKDNGSTSKSRFGATRC